jgi:large-conductance mechanosensitive channel
VDWIERLFHVSPDGGSGYVEWVIVAFVLFLVVAPVWRRVRRSRPETRARRLRSPLRRADR